jgi:glycosyltransferase involved in cell wall biosynthesis
MTTDERQHVAVVVTRFVAGAGGVALRGALALDRERFRVTILSAPGGRLHEQARDEGLETVMLDHMSPEISPVNDRRAVRELIHYFQSNKTDVVHTHSAKAGAVGRIAAHRSGVPAIIHTFHGFPFHNFQSRARRAAYISIERRLGRLTHEFHAIGDTVAAEAIRLGIATPERVRVVASAIETGIVPTSPERRSQARRILGVDDTTPLVGTVGRLDFQKAPLDMIRAIAAMQRDDVHLMWVGGGPLMDEALQLIERSGLSDRIKLLGERRDVPRILPAFDVFAMSSLYEGIPCAVIEAMSCGIPVAATAVNGVPEVVKHRKTGLLARPGEPETLARAIEMILDDPLRAQEMAEAARVGVVDDFDPALLGEALNESYTRALQRKAPQETPLAARVTAPALATPDTTRWNQSAYEGASDGY